MKLLLDTRALLWFLVDDNRLASTTRALLADPTNEIFVSAASAWEIAIKVSLGKLTLPSDIATWLPAQLTASRLTPLAITVAHAAAVEHLPPHHSDPFDRLLIAQARAENLSVVTSDSHFERYDVRVVRC